MNLSTDIFGIKQYLSEIDAEEGITPKLLDFVDLTVAYSPVIAIRGESLER